MSDRVANNKRLLETGELPLYVCACLFFEQLDIEVYQELVETLLEDRVDEISIETWESLKGKNLAYKNDSGWVLDDIVIYGLSSAFHDIRKDFGAFNTAPKRNMELFIDLEMLLQDARSEGLFTEDFIVPEDFASLVDLGILFRTEGLLKMSKLGQIAMLFKEQLFFKREPAEA